MAPHANCQALRYSEFIQIRDEHIAARAHHRWLLRGSSEGSFAADWSQAENEFDRELVAVLNLGLAA